MDVSLSELREFVMEREAWRAAIHGVTKSRTWLSDWSDICMFSFEARSLASWIIIGFMFAEYSGPRCSQVTYSQKSGWDLLVLSSQNFMVSAKPLMDFALDKLQVVNVWDMGGNSIVGAKFIDEYIFLPKLFELLVEMMEFQLSYFKSWKMMLWKCCTQYTSKFGVSAVATGLEKVSFHSNPKERQCQRMLKLLHSCTHLTR